MVVQPESYSVLAAELHRQVTPYVCNFASRCTPEGGGNEAGNGGRAQHGHGAALLEASGLDHLAGLQETQTIPNNVLPPSTKECAVVRTVSALASDISPHRKTVHGKDYGMVWTMDSGTNSGTGQVTLRPPPPFSSNQVTTCDPGDTICLP